MRLPCNNGFVLLPLV